MRYCIPEERDGMGDQMWERVASSVSIKDRSVVGCADRGLNCTNRIPGVVGSRNRYAEYCFTSKVQEPAPNSWGESSSRGELGCICLLLVVSR